MEDPVGDVLVERAALDNGAAGGIVFSLLLHGTITAAAVYAAFHHAPPQEVNMLTIRLAPMTPANAAPAAAAPPAPAPPVPRIEEPKPVVEQPKPAEQVKPQKNTAPPSPFGKSTKKAGEVPPAPPVAAPPRAPGVAGLGDVPVGAAGVTGIEGDFQNAIYIERMRQLIGTHWFRPQIASGEPVTIYFEIQTDGTIANVKMEKSSGNGTADRAALRAVVETAQLPPLPFSYGGTFLGVHLTFK